MLTTCDDGLKVVLQEIPPRSYMQLSQDRGSINEIAAFLTLFGGEANSEKIF